MSKLIDVSCAWCGATLQRYPSQIKNKRFIFCNRLCMTDFGSPIKNPGRYRELKDLSAVSKHMSDLNRKMNPTRMNSATRQKLRDAHLGTGEGKTYTKIYGRHAHRAIMESHLGRALKSGEVVHHKDGNKRNNSIDNLQLFSSQSEHVRWHHWQERKRGDAE